MEQIIKEVHSIPGIEKIGITTNGLLLPRKLEALQRAGLNQLNISLDTLQAEKFTEITRRNGFERVIQAIDLALTLGFDPLKVNCVIMRGMNDTEIIDFAHFTRDRAVDVRFIEYMPFDGNAWNDQKLVSYQEMLGNIQEVYPSLGKLVDLPNDTAKSESNLLLPSMFFLCLLGVRLASPWPCRSPQLHNLNVR